MQQVFIEKQDKHFPMRKIPSEPQETWNIGINIEEHGI